MSIILFRKCGPYDGNVIDAFSFDFEMHHWFEWTDNPFIHAGTPQSPTGPFVQGLNYEVMDSLNAFALTAIFLDQRPKPGLWTITIDMTPVVAMTPAEIAAFGTDPTYDYNYRVSLGGALYSIVGDNFRDYSQAWNGGTEPDPISDEWDCGALEFTCFCDGVDQLAVTVQRLAEMVGWSFDISISGVWISDFP